jgi:putative two-component system response regulator
MKMRTKMLIVDDAKMNREILETILCEEYSIIQAEDGKQALELLEKHHTEIVAVLLDLMMPEMDGYAVLDVMRQRGWMDHIPVLVISGETEIKAETKCFDYGVSDFIHKPFDNTLVKKRIHNIVSLFQYQNELEEKVAEQTKKLQSTNESIIDILGTIVEFRHLESGEHIQRVKGFTEILGYEMMEKYPEYGLTEQKIKTIVTASSLHDLGKIAIPDNILMKPDRLTDEEFKIMKSHTTRGSEVLEQYRDIWDEEYQKASYEICRYHHERYDGRGYPDGLVGEEIPISAQIVSIADVYDALVSERVYKSAYSTDKAYQMIMARECGVFSPKLLEAFRNVKDKFADLAANAGE